MNFKIIALAGIASLWMTSAFSQDWQQSESTQVELGIREKFGEKPFVAEFIVSPPGGKPQTRKINVAADEFGSVNYPKDFGGYMAPGKYTWKARVNGKDVVNGQFVYQQDRSGSKLSIAN